MEDDYKKLVTDCKSFLKTKYDLLRLELLDKLSIILGLLVFIIVGLFILLAAVAYFSAFRLASVAAFLASSGFFEMALCS